MNAIFHRLATDVLHVIAPSLCPACDAQMVAGEHFYCAECHASLEPAPFPRDILQELNGHFSTDELALSAIGSLYTFTPESPVQRLIHALKYSGCRQLGIEMGGELGQTLKMFTDFDGIECIVPVPLHRAKRRERGYNQSEAIAEGLMSVLPSLRILRPLVRTRHTPSQTTLGAHDRRNNVRDAFRVVSEEIRGRVILLCDDVFTTGATLNACAEVLLGAGARKVCAATLAMDIPHRETFTKASHSTTNNLC